MKFAIALARGICTTLFAEPSPHLTRQRNHHYLNFAVPF